VTAAAAPVKARPSGYDRPFRRLLNSQQREDFHYPCREKTFRKRLRDSYLRTLDRDHHARAQYDRVFFVAVARELQVAMFCTPQWPDAKIYATAHNGGTARVLFGPPASLNVMLKW
jgi:hypothetical protein